MKSVPVSVPRFPETYARRHLGLINVRALPDARSRRRVKVGRQFPRASAAGRLRPNGLTAEVGTRLHMYG